MSRQIPFSSVKLDKTMSPEQFNQIIDAILEGKYSWACVLLLRFAGYNPLDYIPYRTYNRLLKENCQIGNQNRCQTDRVSIDTECLEFRSDDTNSQRCLSKINDLAHLEVIGKQHPQIKGGNLEHCLDIKALVYKLLPFELLPTSDQFFLVSDCEFTK